MTDFRRHVRAGYGVVLLCSAATLCAAASHSSTPVNPAAITARYGKLPMRFEENRGQTDRQVKFLSYGQGYSMFLTSTGAVLSLQSTASFTRPDEHAAIRMDFSGARPASLTGEERQATTSSYFVGNDRTKWVSGAPNYTRVRYRGLYPGVDLVFYGNQRQLEYDLVLAPGAHPNAIHLRFDGVNGMRLDGAGNLILSTAVGDIRQQRPVIYQERDGRPWQGVIRFTRTAR
jgi:hypothetical protein